MVIPLIATHSPTDRMFLQYVPIVGYGRASPSFLCPKFVKKKTKTFAGKFNWRARSVVIRRPVNSRVEEEHENTKYLIESDIASLMSRTHPVCPIVCLECGK